jgi:glycerol-3-phosphate acyltransferase PlsY
MFPLWLRFRGGKGMATGLGVLLASAWPVGVLACAIWLAVAGLLRRSSLATLTAILAAPLLAWALADRGEIWLAAIVALLIWARHHANIRRLLAGTEPRIGARH